MSTEVDLLDTDYMEFATYLGMAPPVEWEGREVSLKEQLDYENAIEQRITHLFQSLATDPGAFNQMAIYLARAGASPEERALLERDIQQLICTPEGVFVAGVGFFKEIGKFWKKHKKEILVGVAIVAVVVAVVVIASCTGGAAVAAAGGACLDSLSKDTDKDSKKDTPPPQQAPQQNQPLPLAETQPVPSSNNSSPFLPANHSESLALPQDAFLIPPTNYASSTDRSPPQIDTQPSPPVALDYQLMATPPKKDPMPMVPEGIVIGGPGTFTRVVPFPSFQNSTVDEPVDHVNSRPTTFPETLEGSSPNQRNSYIASSQDELLHAIDERLQQKELTRESSTSPLTAGEQANANELRYQACRDAIAAATAGRELDVSPGAKPDDSFASSIQGTVKNGKTPHPFQEIHLVGHRNQSTIDFHCGINNNVSSVSEGGSCLYESLGGEFAVQPHLIHSDNLVSGLAMVQLEQAVESSIPVMGMLQYPVAEFVLKNSKIQESIEYEIGNLTQKAQEIIEIGNPNLKQVHVTFSNGGYVFKEALKQIPPEYRETVVVITTGTTAIIQDDLACAVYNVIGSKDWPSKTCNGGDSGIKYASKESTVYVIPQDESKLLEGGHYFMQSDYQKEIKTIINEKIVNQYEIY